MKEPLTFQQAKDEVARNYGYHNWQYLRADINIPEHFIDEIHRCFIDSLRGKIEEMITKHDAMMDSLVLEDLTGPLAFRGGMDKILTLLNETSGETGK